LNVTVWSNMAADRWLSISCSVLIGVLLLAGCLPIPVVPHGLGVVPDKEAFESLRPGVTTRADVLLLLGEPNHRFDDDRFLMYEWTVAYGYVIVGGYTQAYPIPVAAPHYLCLEFGLDSRLVRNEHLIGSLYAKPDKAIRRCTKQSEELDESGEK